MPLSGLWHSQGEDGKGRERFCKWVKAQPMVWGGGDLVENAPFKPGDHVLAKTASGTWRPMRATSEVEPGHRFPVIWLCQPEAWRPGLGREAAVPWPAEYVRPAAKRSQTVGV